MNANDYVLFESGRSRPSGCCLTKYCILFFIELLELKNAFRLYDCIVKFIATNSVGRYFRNSQFKFGRNSRGFDYHCQGRFLDDVNN